MDTAFGIAEGVIFWAVVPMILLYNMIDDFRFNMRFKHALKNKILSIDNTMENTCFDGPVVPINTFVSYAEETNLPFLHIEINMPRLCAFEYRVCDSKCENIQDGRIDSTTANTICFPIRKDETYTVWMKIAVCNKVSYKRSGLAQVFDMSFGTAGKCDRKFYSPFFHKFEANEYLKICCQKSSAPVSPTAATNTRAPAEEDTRLSLKQRQQISYFRPATSREIDAARVIQLVVRRYFGRVAAARVIQRAVRRYFSRVAAADQQQPQQTVFLSEDIEDSEDDEMIVVGTYGSSSASSASNDSDVASEIRNGWRYF